MSGLKNRRRSKSKTKLNVRRKTKSPKKDRPIIEMEDWGPVDWFPSGSTRLNLALSGKPDRGWARARCDNIVGDRSAGKTLLALEAAANFFYYIPTLKSKIFKRKKDPIVVLNNGEGVLDFNVRMMYDDPFADALILLRSPHIQHAGRDFIRRAQNLKKNQALLYIIDTWDMFRSKEQLQRFDDSVKSDDESSSSYDGEKQRWAAGFFSKTAELMYQNRTDATLIIVSQVRMTMKSKPFQKEKYRTGGKSFDHAMHQEAWVWEKGKVKKTKLGEERVFSLDVGVNIEKNKTAKPYRKAEFTILYDYGIDDLTSLILYVIGKPSTKSVKTWNGKKFKSMDQIVNYIESNNYEEKIKKQAATKFRKVERAFELEVLKRKKRWNSPIAG